MEVARLNVVGTQFSWWLSIGLRHRIPLCIDRLIAHLEGKGKRKQLMGAITGLAWRSVVNVEAIAGTLSLTQELRP